MRNRKMSKMNRWATASAVAVLMAGVMAFAQSQGASTYKAHCQMCHGMQGTPNPGIAKMMGVKPAKDPAVKKLTEAQMIEVTTNGKGKMPAFKSKLSGAQIKDAVTYFRTFTK